MARPPIKPVDDKLRIVLAVLGGEVSIKEVARRERVSETSIAAWRDQFLDGGRAALAAGAGHGPSAHEAELQAQSRSSPAPSARPTWSCGCGAKGGGLPGFQDLEVIRAEAGLSVVRFCDLLGMPRATWSRWRAAVTGGAARPVRARGRRRWSTGSSRWPPSTPSSGRPGPPQGLGAAGRRRRPGQPG